MRPLSDYYDAFDSVDERAAERAAAIDREADAIIADKERLVDVVCEWLACSDEDVAGPELLAALYASECTPAPSWAKDELPRMIRQLGMNLYQAVTEAAADSVDAKMRKRREGGQE